MGPLGITRENNGDELAVSVRSFCFHGPPWRFLGAVHVISGTSSFSATGAVGAENVVFEGSFHNSASAEPTTIALLSVAFAGLGFSGRKPGK